MARTKDELYIICAYETAMKAGDLFVELDRYDVGQSCGISPKAVDAITNLLARANFIRKVGDRPMFLTKNGEALALRLLEE